MKDFFDILTLSKQFPLNSKRLAAAIEATFHRRGTPIISSPECFSEAFAKNPEKNQQWQSFARKNSINGDSLPDVVDHIKKFLHPILHGLIINELPDQKWNPSDRWTE
jgi:hypothetical protein